MYWMDEKTGDIYIQQGDYFSFRIKNVDNKYSAFFAVSDVSHNIIFELPARRENNDVIFEVFSGNSNLLEVPRGRKQEIYNYGIKLCRQVGNEWIEETLVVGNKNIGEPNKITVYPLLAEGAKNG